MKQTLALASLSLLVLAGAALADAPAPKQGKPPDQTDQTADKKVEKKPAKPAKPGKGEEKEKDEEKPTHGGLDADTLAGLELRGIGPALVSGRVVDIAVDPTDKATYFVAAASGGVWKTTNSGNTWTPVFDGEGSYSIGCLAIDPKDPLTVWVGTGENNSQRSVSYGDGVYKSVDGGKSWDNVGLKASEHIGKILIDPRDSKSVYVAAQGPLWASGGDRGLYKTTDGGKSWKQVLKVSDDTGVTDVVLDPRDPDVLYAAAYQRRRHVWTLLDGGPESAIYRSTDAGASWTKVVKGLPKEDLGRIGLAISPADPSKLYAIVEAANKKGGFFRSTDRGASWEMRGDYVSGSPQYYQELFPDPKDPDRIYAMDTWMKVSEDGGKSFVNFGETSKHVDNHALWIDPDATDHLRAGCDGGVYESWDRGANWQWMANLPLSQFYNVALDDSKPFYYVYGGTQDNSSLGGPSRTATANGIANSDWFFTVGGDGFVSRVDPEDPNTVYSEYQYGGLVRFDRRTGEMVDIQPQPGKDEPALRYNWDSPLIISPHSHTRLYFAANRLYRSDDRGDSWKPVSPDLTRQIDRRKLEIMGRTWSADAVALGDSTSFYGNVVALAESPLAEGVIYAGTDDGLVQVTEDGGGSWRKVESFPGVPDKAYVSDLEASPLDAGTVYATFDNHKMGDFKPYVLKSTDRGRTWSSIAGDLPARGSVHTLVEDPGKAGLLFAGIEFGLFFTPDGGGKWIQLKGGMPAIAVRDLAIQRRENDLVAASFGRGFFVLDDYTPLRLVSAEALAKPELLFPVARALMFVPSQPIGGKDKADQGDSYFTAPNPPSGAVFTYYLKDELKTRKAARHDAEKKLVKEKKPIPYPDWDELTAEAREKDPQVVLTVTDEEGDVVRRLTGPVTAGIHRVAWDLRYPATTPTDLAPKKANRYSEAPEGALVAPGSFKVSLATWVDGKETPLPGGESFEAVPLGLVDLPAAQRQALADFQKKTARLQRAVLGAGKAADEAADRLAHIEKALTDTPASDADLLVEARALENRLKDLQVALEGDPVKGEYNAPTPPSISDRMQHVVFGDWGATIGPTETHRRDYEIASQELAPVLDQLRQLIEVDLKGLEDRMEAIGAPWTPGRVPTWKPE